MFAMEDDSEAIEYQGMDDSFSNDALLEDRRSGRA
jgi:hypothetical protein